MSKILRFKKRAILKILFMLVLILPLIILSLYLSKLQVLKTRYGEFLVGDCIYVSLSISSRDSLKARVRNGEVVITKDSFCVHYKNEEPIYLENINYKKQVMTPAIAKELEHYGIAVSDYQKKYVYSIYKGPREISKYKIFELDSELWIVFCTDYFDDPFTMTYIHSIFKLI